MNRSCLLVLPLLLLGCSSPEARVAPSSLTGKPLEWVAAAQSALDHGDYLTGLAFTDSALTLIPNRPEPHFLAGRLHAELNAYANAEQAYGQTAGIDADYPGLWLNRGNVAFAQQHYKQALDMYRRESLAEARVRHAFGGALEAMGKVDSARVAYEEAMRMDPDYPPAAYSLAKLLDSIGETEAARSAVQRAMVGQRAGSAAPPRSAYVLLAARLESQAGNSDESLTLLKPLVEAEPWNYSAIFALGQALRLSGAEQEARRALGRADSVRAEVSVAEKLELSVRDAPSAVGFGQYGDALRRLGRVPEATDAYQRAVALDPDLIPLQVNLAGLYLQAGRDQEGVGRLQALVTRHPESVDGWINLALYSGRQRDLAGTRRYLKRAAAIAPEHPMVLRLQSSLPPEPPEAGRP